jgi:hypothetical protein
MHRVQFFATFLSISSIWQSGNRQSTFQDCSAIAEERFTRESPDDHLDSSLSNHRLESGNTADALLNPIVSQIPAVSDSFLIVPSVPFGAA